MNELKIQIDYDINGVINELFQRNGVAVPDSADFENVVSFAVKQAVKGAKVSFASDSAEFKVSCEAYAISDAVKTVFESVVHDINSAYREKFLNEVISSLQVGIGRTSDNANEFDVVLISGDETVTAGQIKKVSPRKFECSMYIKKQMWSKRNRAAQEVAIAFVTDNLPTFLDLIAKSNETLIDSGDEIA